MTGITPPTHRETPRFRVSLPVRPPARCASGGGLGRAIFRSRARCTAGALAPAASGSDRAVWYPTGHHGKARIARSPAKLASTPRGQLHPGHESAPTHHFSAVATPVRGPHSPRAPASSPLSHPPGPLSHCMLPAGGLERTSHVSTYAKPPRQVMPWRGRFRCPPLAPAPHARPLWRKLSCLSPA